jgi:hypothetical protein
MIGRSSPHIEPRPWPRPRWSGSLTANHCGCPIWVPFGPRPIVAAHPNFSHLANAQSADGRCADASNARPRSPNPSSRSAEPGATSASPNGRQRGLLLKRRRSSISASTPGRQDLRLLELDCGEDRCGLRHHQRWGKDLPRAPDRVRMLDRLDPERIPHRPPLPRTSLRQSRPH